MPSSAKRHPFVLATLGNLFASSHDELTILRLRTTGVDNRQSIAKFHKTAGLEKYTWEEHMLIPSRNDEDRT
jgi:hypothetical protein